MDRTLFAALVLAIALGAGSAVCAGQAGSPPKANVPMTEPYRPLYHYTPAQNFMNDPNGLVYFKGEYHLFHQYNPFGNTWGHMSWAHAVSRDLVHWQPLPVALSEADGVMIFSGSAVADLRNTSGFGTIKNPPLVAIYTGHRPADEMQSQCLAYSVDRGRTWTKYGGNPVLTWEKDFRDPKVFWHAPTGRWIMVVSKAADRRLRFYGSPDLKHWSLLSEFGPAGVPDSVKANWECPDLFEVPIADEPGHTKWVLHCGMGNGHINGGSGGEYFVGEFDGARYVNDNPPETVLWADYGRDDYAAVSWSGKTGPNGEPIWAGWMSNWQYANDVPTSPWRNGITLPRLLSLRRIDGALRLVQRPIPQLKALRGAMTRFGARQVAGRIDLTIGRAPQPSDSVSLNSRAALGGPNRPRPEGTRLTGPNPPTPFPNSFTPAGAGTRLTGKGEESASAPSRLREGVGGRKSPSLHHGMEIEAEFEPGTAREFGLALRCGEGEQTLVGYDTAAKQLFVDRTHSGRADFTTGFGGRHAGPMGVRGGRIKLHIFVDTASVEVFGNDGETVITDLIFPRAESQGLALYAEGGGARLVQMRVWRLRPSGGD